MSKKIRFIALLIVALMGLSILAACGNSDKDTPNDDSKPGTNNEEPVAGEPAIMRFVTPGNMPPDAQTGIKAVNDKLQADGVNIEVEPIRIPWDAYDQKLNLMMSTGEAFELLHVMQDVKNISSLASKNALQPIDDYIDKYPDLKANFTETEWRAGVYDGKIYAVPARWRSFDNALGYVTARTDVMDKYTDGKDPETVEEIIEVSKKMQSDIEEEIGKKPYMWPHQLSASPAWLHRTYDNFPFYVENSIGLVLINQDGSVDSYYESDTFKKDAETYRGLYKDGLIHPDILNTVHEQKYDEVAIGAVLPSETFGYGDLVSMQENIPDAEMRVFFLAPEKPNMIYTLSQNLNAISATAEDPESGLKFLDWLYKDKENHDLFHYGIEGTHYTASADDRIEYIKDEANQNLYGFDTWMTGFLPFMRYDERTPAAGIEFDQFQSENKVISPAAAFLFDASAVESELANLQTEIISSIYPIKYGLVDYESEFPKALEKLKAAGLDAYLEEYRVQFAKYLEENPDMVQK